MSAKTRNQTCCLEKEIRAIPKPSLSVTKVDIPTNCVDATILTNAGVDTIRPSLVDPLTSTVTNGSGNNSGVGNRYTLTFPNLGTDSYGVYLQPIGFAANNALIPHILTQTPTSVTYGFYSGDDGNGVDDFRRVQHHILITGCLVEIINNVELLS